MNFIINNTNEIAAALFNLKLQIILTYSTIAYKYEVVCTILIKQYRIKIISNDRTTIEY